ncbi:unnamed protein product [Nesidiocoris tenuis]|uniref:Mitochondrial inner membrane protease subunit 2 n=1 Tax=Nesidiocoris tenuis TaxID=355587 RepID=A0A6H5H4V5_9HEMI|nr:unnamed protein product [Nesidiocoris tenuis]CAB0012524.1 unnamed protein product [Nesidiocoris tenuis]
MTLVELFKTVFFGIPIGITIIDVVGYPVLNPGAGKGHDYVFLKKSSHFNRGDVVCLYSPRDKDQKLIKRVIALEGDTVKTLTYKHSSVTIPVGHCWVEGDNASNSMDSNLFGPIALACLTATATSIVWPPSRWQFVKSFVPEHRIPENFRIRSRD